VSYRSGSRCCTDDVAMRPATLGRRVRREIYETKRSNHRLTNPWRKRAKTPVKRTSTINVKLASDDGSGVVTKDSAGAAKTTSSLFKTEGDVITWVPEDGLVVGKSISISAIPLFGLVVGMLFRELSSRSTINVSGVPESGLSVVIIVNPSDESGLSRKLIPLKNELSVIVKPNGPPVRVTPAVSDEGTTVRDAGSEKFESVTVLFPSPVPLPSVN
jgi:hypothetical protein